MIWACKNPEKPSENVSSVGAVEQEPNQRKWDYELIQLLETASQMQALGIGYRIRYKCKDKCKDRKSLGEYA